jgi:predicted membrane-bound spermidine synthase
MGVVETPVKSTNANIVAIPFFISGVSAIIYQVVWQRCLLAIVGVDIQSVTLIVSIFMAGLGIGALIGGYLAQRFSPLKLFLFAEICIGLFGLVSITLLRQMGAVLVQHPGLLTAAATAFLFIPTAWMGATLPILVEHLNLKNDNAPDNLAWLYMANTLGAAAACYLTVDVLFVYSGLRNAAIAAAGLNFMTAALIYWQYKRSLRV